MGLTLLAFLAFAAFVALVGVGIALKLFDLRGAAVRKALRAVPRTPVAAVRPRTMVKLVGRVRYAGPPLVAPLSGQACTYFHVCVERRELTEEDDSAGRPTLTRNWIALCNEVEQRPFTLEDDTGSALVKLDICEVLVLRVATESTELLPASPLLAEYLRAHRVLDWERHVLRSEERILTEGDEVAVLGWATLEATDGGVGEPVTRVVVSHTPEAAVRVATTDAIGA